LTEDRDYIGKVADEFDIFVGDKEDEAESLNHSGMLALVDKEGNVDADLIKTECLFCTILVSITKMQKVKCKNWMENFSQIENF
jgi:hypothetical protein